MRIFIYSIILPRHEGFSESFKEIIENRNYITLALVRNETER